MAARGARAILSQGTAMISTAISMNSAEIGKRDLHIPDLVDQTELDYLKPRRGVPETAD
jgi:hypothetical protein